MDLPIITGDAERTAAVARTVPLVAGADPAAVRAADLQPAVHARAPGTGGQPQRTGVPALLRSRRRAGRRARRARPSPAADARLLGQPPLGAGPAGPARGADGASAHDGARPGA